jgi:hypothetical protein
VFAPAFSLPPGSVLGVAGSRSVASLPSPVAAVLASAAGGGCSLAVGCCVGVDSLALRCALRLRVSLSVFAAFGPPPAFPGSCSLSAVGVVSRAASAGVPVRWWAGGGAAVPLRARLSRRSSAVVAASSALLVVFASPSPGGGSCSVASWAASAGVPVFGLPARPGSSLPSPGAGAWVPASLFGVPCLRWSSAVLSLPL